VGPTTFSDMDNVELGDDHRDHWVDEVLPNVKEISEGSYWRMSDKLTYEGTTGFTGKEVLTFFKIKNFEEYRFKAMVEKVKEVYVAKEYPNFFQVYYSEFSRICGYDAMIAGGFENWAFFDNKPNFKADYEEVHGEGSFQMLLEEYREIVENEYDEIIMYAPKLSADPAE
jgi:predicted nucleotide-binding protein (sugar kinase/HSP70/actin superfamily)